MKYRIVVLACLVASVVGSGYAQEGERKSVLWPPIEPYKTGYLKVSDLHEIYWEVCGNPQGMPVFVLHGGPGGGCSPQMRRYFDPEKFMIVLHDQRGAGRSKPLAETRENTTQYLVADIERLREKLGVDKMILFGGSWGSTLALAYAETYPQNVAGMVLRGVFTATQGEIDHFYHGGVRKFFPEVYDHFVEELGNPQGGINRQVLMDKLTSADPETVKKFADLWARYEIKIVGLEIPDQLLDNIMSGFDPLDFAMLETHYMLNNCFLEEGQLMRNADRLSDIRVVIVQGRYDMICPPITAYLLHKKLPKSELIIVEQAGHSAYESGIESGLVKAMEGF